MADVEASTLAVWPRKKNLGRAFVAFAVAGALLAMLVFWFNRESGVGDFAESRPTDDSDSPSSIVERLRPAPDRPSDVSESEPLRTEPNIMAHITGQRLPDVEVPPWSDEMEATILSYIAQYPNLALTDLQVQCAEDGCVIFMGGGNIPIYDMNFDVFANEHGFDGAIIRGNGNEARTVVLRRKQ